MNKAAYETGQKLITIERVGTQKCFGMSNQSAIVTNRGQNIKRKHFKKTFCKNKI